MLTKIHNGWYVNFDSMHEVGLGDNFIFIQYFGSEGTSHEDMEPEEVEKFRAKLDEHLGLPVGDKS
jgi:uncharacterized metal-binding protein